METVIDGQRVTAVNATVANTFKTIKQVNGTVTNELNDFFWSVQNNILGIALHANFSKGQFKDGLSGLYRDPGTGKKVGGVPYK